MKRTKQNGITLIALVITIVVLLILAGVTIATLTGDNGILTRANDAKTQTGQAGAVEKVEVEVLGSYANNGVLDKEKLSENLENNVEGLTSGTPIESFPATVTVDGYDVLINEDGSVELDTSITLGEAKDDSMLTKTDNSKVKVEDGSFTLPGGFKVAEDSGSTVEEGIVITDGESEFVWVPAEVNEIANETEGKDDNENQNYQGKLYDFTSTGANEMEEDYGQGTTSYREPDVVTSYDNNPENLEIITGILPEEDNAEKYNDIDAFEKTMQEDYNKMVKSVGIYHGFYVSRYEMSKSTSSNTAVSVANVTPLVNDSSNMWYGLYAYGKTYTNNNIENNTVESSMIWGSQYDAMMRWMQSGEHGVDVTDDIGNNRNGGSTTGSTSTDVIKKVYDLYGCHYEWTLEALDANGRVYRGRFLLLHRFT